MSITNIHEAKTHFSRLIEKAAKGEEVIIAKAGKPIVKLIPYVEKKQARKPGRLKGKFKIADDFDDDLPPDILAAFYEGEIFPPSESKK